MPTPSQYCCQAASLVTDSLTGGSLLRDFLPKVKLAFWFEKDLSFPLQNPRKFLWQDAETIDERNNHNRSEPEYFGMPVRATREIFWFELKYTLVHCTRVISCSACCASRWFRLGIKCTRSWWLRVLVTNIHRFAVCSAILPESTQQPIPKEDILQKQTSQPRD